MAVDLKNIFKKIMIALGVILLTFLFAEAIVRVLVVQAVPSESLSKSYDAKYQLAQRALADDKSLILIGGDSLADFAIYPELLKIELYKHGYEASVLNLASPGNTVERSIFLLKTAIKAGNKPNLIIYDLHPRLFNNFFLENDLKPTHAGYLQKQSYLGGCLDIKPDMLSATSCFLKKNIFLFHYRDFLKKELDTIMTTILQPKNRLKLNVAVSPEIEVSPDGWAPGYKVFDDASFMREYQKPAYYQKVATELFHYRWTDHTLVTIDDFCRRQNIPLIVVWLPGQRINSDYYHAFGLSENYFTQNFSSLTDRLDVDFINLHPAISDSEEFHDPDHVNPVGAVDLTKKLGIRLSQDKLFQSTVRHL